MTRLPMEGLLTADAVVATLTTVDETGSMLSSALRLSESVLVVVESLHGIESVLEDVEVSGVPLIRVTEITLRRVGKAITRAECRRGSQSALQVLALSSAALGRAAGPHSFLQLRFQLWAAGVAAGSRDGRARRLEVLSRPDMVCGL